jgi:hypothetical protein
VKKLVRFDLDPPGADFVRGQTVQNFLAPALDCADDLDGEFHEKMRPGLGDKTLLRISFLISSAWVEKMLGTRLSESEWNFFSGPLVASREEGYSNNGPYRARSAETVWMRPN